MKKGSARGNIKNKASGQEFQAHLNAREDLALKAQLLDISGEAIFAWELNGCIEYWNNGGTILYGYSRTDALGCISHELLKTVFPESLDAIKTALQRNGQWRGELTHKHKNGQSIEVESIMKLVYIGDRWLVLESNRDIAERKTYEKILEKERNLLKQTEERFTRAFRSSPAALAITRLADGRYLEVNDSLLQMMGYSREEMVGYTSTELNVYMDPRQRDMLVRTLKKKGKIENQELSFRTKGNKNVHTVLSMEVISSGGEELILSSIVDLTRLKAAEQALSASEANFHSIFDKSPIGIVVGDDQGRVIQSNYMFEAMLGYSKEELTGKNFKDFTHPDDLNTELPLIAELLAGKRSSFEIEKKTSEKTGRSSGSEW